jgi:hypothetical protein
MVAREGEAGELDEGPRLERAWAVSSATGSGLVAVPAGSRGTLMLTAAPTGADVAEPAPSASPSPEPTQGQVPDPEATAEPTGPAITVTVRGYTATGAQDAVDVEVPVGATVAYDVRAELGADVVGVEVLDPEDPVADVAWALMAAVYRPDGPLLSVVAPLTDATAVDRAEVRAGTRVGLD